MAILNTSTKPEETYNFDDFIAVGKSNDMTFDKFSIKEKVGDYIIVTNDVLDSYLDEILMCCVKVTEMTPKDKVRYRYNPDLLAWDLYGNTQLDYLILLCNDMADPKEFDLKKNYLMLPRPSILKELLSQIYESEHEWIEKSRDSINK